MMFILTSSIVFVCIGLVVLVSFNLQNYKHVFQDIDVRQVQVNFVPELKR